MMSEMHVGYKDLMNMPVTALFEIMDGASRNRGN